jgi:hypothetical protein
MFYHRSGYRMQGEQMASHSRKRYRLVPPNPAVTNVDASLFLVHYARASQRDMVPASSINIPPQVRHSLEQRRAIQSQGQLARKEFMLHDRSNWPTINAPQGLARAGHRRGTSAGHEVSLEEEEDVSRGDVLDFMTPRDISRIRYEQHHEWMEEILESPYNIAQIVPGDLGLGRKGELEVLTKDFFDAPLTVLRETTADNEPPRVGRLEDGQFADFNKRASQKIADMEAEIEKLKRQHSARIARLKRSSVLNSAEKRLRTASTTAQRSMSNASAPEEEPDALDDIANEVEGSLGRKIEKISTVSLVERGGLDERAPARSLSMSSSNRPAMSMSPVKAMASPSVPQQAVPLQQTTPTPQTAPAIAPGGAEAPIKVAEVSSAMNVDTAEPVAAGKQPEANGQSQGQELSLSDTGDNDEKMGDSNEPADSGNAIALGESNDLDNLDDDWIMDMDTGVGEKSSNGKDSEQQSAAQSENGGASASAQPQTEATKLQQQVQTPTGNTPNQGTPAEHNQSENMDGNEFSEAFGDVDTAGDALASYGDGNDEELNLDGMDDSAFGDAFHQEEELS